MRRDGETKNHVKSRRIEAIEGAEISEENEIARKTTYGVLSGESVQSPDDGGEGIRCSPCLYIVLLSP